MNKEEWRCFPKKEEMYAICMLYEPLFFLPSGLTSSNRRALHVDGAQKTDYVLPHLRQSRNSELCLTQSQYTDTGPTSRTRRSWGKCNGVDAGAYHTGFPAEAPYPTFPLTSE